MKKRNLPSSPQSTCPDDTRLCLLTETFQVFGGLYAVGLEVFEVTHQGLKKALLTLPTSRVAFRWEHAVEQAGCVRVPQVLGEGH